MRTILATYTDGLGGAPLGGALVQIPDKGSVVALVREHSTKTGCACAGYLHWQELPEQALKYFASVPRHRWLTVAELKAILG